MFSQPHVVFESKIFVRSNIINPNVMRYAQITYIRWYMINNKTVCFDYVIIDIIIYVSMWIFQS